MSIDLGVCDLCGSPRRADNERCGACGMPAGLAKPAPSPFSPAARWAVAGGVVAIYFVVLALVAALR